MVRILLFLLVVFALGLGFAWLADRPGDMLVTFDGYQYQVSLMVAAVAIPLAGSLFPALAATSVVGIRLNWLVLAVLAYPMLYGVGRLYVRLAEQGERDFVRVVDEDP